MTCCVLVVNFFRIFYVKFVWMGLYIPVVIVKIERLHKDLDLVHDVGTVSGLCKQLTAYGNYV